MPISVGELCPQRITLASFDKIPMPFWFITRKLVLTLWTWALHWVGRKHVIYDENTGRRVILDICDPSISDAKVDEALKEGIGPRKAEFDLRGDKEPEDG